MASATTVESLGPALDRILVRLGFAGNPDLSFALLHYLQLLQQWNATYNLTSIRDPAQMLTQHLADCLAVISPLRVQLQSRSSIRLLDVGSGGGLPGIVVAATCPDIEVSCVDAVGKKAAFVRQVGAELRLPNIAALHARVEALEARPFDVITSRAFSSLGDFVSLTRRLVKPDGLWMAMKGKRPDAEIAEVPAAIDVFHVEPIVVPDLPAERCLVWMRPAS